MDGLVEGRSQEVDWPIVDEELHEGFIEELAEMDAFLYSRRTYDLLAAFWPTADADPAISEFYVRHARLWKKAPKFVFSSMLDNIGWNTTVINSDVVTYIRALKAGRDAKVSLFGCPELVAPLVEHDLIDEYRLFVHPMLLGAGKRLFPLTGDRSKLELVETRSFSSAVLYTHYRRIGS